MHLTCAWISVLGIILAPPPKFNQKLLHLLENMASGENRGYLVFSKGKGQKTQRLRELPFSGARKGSKLAP